MANLDFASVYQYAKRPALFEKSTASLWDDPHISQGMLAAHLDSNHDLASRTGEFMDRSVDWMSRHCELKAGAKILDLGCGPGLYAMRLAKMGYQVTGVDFSRRSIDYAKSQAASEGVAINYIYQDYLTLDYHEEFDLAILIYCDLGVLAPSERDPLLAKIARSLKPRGRLILDVFTPEAFVGVSETKRWEVAESGFWRATPYLCLESHFSYPQDNVDMNQYVVLDSTNRVEVYRTWDQYYTPDTMGAVLRKAGFAQWNFFSDVSGIKYLPGSKTLCVAAQKA